MMPEELLSHLSEQRVTEILSDLIRRPTDTETGDYLIDFLTHCGISAEKQDCGEGLPFPAPPRAGTSTSATPTWFPPATYPAGASRPFPPQWKVDFSTAEALPI